MYKSSVNSSSDLINIVEYSFANKHASTSFLESSSIQESSVKLRSDFYIGDRGRPRGGGIGEGGRFKYISLMLLGYVYIHDVKSSWVNKTCTSLLFTVYSVNNLMYL